MSGRGRARGRGRGRGAGRGRGGSRGRGRGGRGGRGVGQNSNLQSADDDRTGDVVGEDLTLDINKDLKTFFVGTAGFNQHFDAQTENKQRYAAGMAVLEKNGVDISQNARARGLAAAWARQDHAMADSLLLNKSTFGLVEVLKALTLLDSARRIREEEKRLKKKLIQTGGKINPKIMGKFKSNIDNLTANRPKLGSASGAVCKHVRNWVRNFTTQELEFYALHFPTEPWKKLADICHFHPQKDFPNLPWFLGYCFGTPAPEGSMVERCREVTDENVNQLIEEHDVPYSHVKSLQGKLSEESKGRIAQTDKLDQILWYYEDLQCSQVDEILSQRFSQGEEITLATGKFLERLLTIKMIRENISSSGSYGRQQEREKNPTKAAFIHHLIPQAQARLKDIRLVLDTPVVVFGDRSSSMEVAIRTSTIIASLLTAICGAKLVFFDHENMVAPFIPTNVEEVLEMAVTIQAGGSTKPAASLWPFYEAKEVIKTIIMVTDEEENGSVHDMRFAEMFKKYRQEVSPHCKLVFVSFLRSQHATGQMISALNTEGIHDNVTCFKFDQKRPDLTKLDKLFGLLSTDMSDFEEQVREMEINMERNGMSEIFKNLQLERDDAQKKKPTIATGAQSSTGSPSAPDATATTETVPGLQPVREDAASASLTSTTVTTPTTSIPDTVNVVTTRTAQKSTSGDDWCVVDHGE